MSEEATSLSNDPAVLKAMIVALQAENQKMSEQRYFRSQLEKYIERMKDTGFPKHFYEAMRQELAVHENAVDGEDLLSDTYLDSDDFCASVGLARPQWEEKVLTLLEIISAKTYDEAADFDMQARWEKFQKKLNDIKYENIFPSVLLQILSLVISESKECKRKTILGVDKVDIIAKWDDVISAIEKTIHHFRTVLRIPVSQILPYDTLIVPFAYFFLKTGKSPSGQQRKYLEELFWRSSLSLRYSSASESKLAADIKKVDLIIAGQRPTYPEFKLFIHSAKDFRESDFSTGSRNTKPMSKAMPLMEVIKESGNKKVAAKTINSHIQKFKMFFDWAERHGNSPHTLFEGMKVKRDKASVPDGRHRYLGRKGGTRIGCVGPALWQASEHRQLQRPVSG